MSKSEVNLIGGKFVIGGGVRFCISVSNDNSVDCEILNTVCFRAKQLFKNCN